MPGVPLVENPLFPSFVDSLGFDSETKRVAMDLHLKGYAVIEFPDPEFAAVAERIQQTLAPHAVTVRPILRFDFFSYRSARHQHRKGRAKPVCGA